MKIILSRKGFDSSEGKVPSPILPSGHLCWLPIPSPYQGIRYRDIVCRQNALGDIAEQLTKGKVSSKDSAHLDPDLRFESLPRLLGWKPLFGQTGAAQSHLKNQGVSKGDIFLFYGWFREVERIWNQYRYSRRAPDLHVIFGWLQIRKTIPVGSKEVVPRWAMYHPHFNRPPSFSNDTVYVAIDSLNIPGHDLYLRGGGFFDKFHPRLVLTAPGQAKKSVWRLPPWFYPVGKKSYLSYHGDLRRWTLEDEYILLHSVGRGQEFVLDCDDYPEAIDWLIDILENAIDSPVLRT